MLAVPSLTASLDAFYLEHRLCWELEGGAEEREAREEGREVDQWVAWMECPECDARCEHDADS